MSGQASTQEILIKALGPSKDLQVQTVLILFSVLAKELGRV